MEINIGIEKADRQAIADGVKNVLADSYTLYLKTHNYHWNVTGPMFQTLHELFEQHYTELATAVDEIAERIRALGVYAPGTYGAFADLTEIEEDDSVPSAEDMIRNLVTAHETVVRRAREAIGPAEKAGDEVTADLLTQRMQIHEKTAWMLRSHLADEAA